MRTHLILVRFPGLFRAAAATAAGAWICWLSQQDEERGVARVGGGCTNKLGRREGEGSLFLWN